LKDAARLLAYFVATVLFGAFLAPPLYWWAQALIAQGHLGLLTKFGFESFFHRALLIGAIVFFWPLLRSLGIRSFRDLGLEENPKAGRDVLAGFGIAAVPLLCFAAGLLVLGVYSFRAASAGALASRWIAAAAVPFIEESLFRGLILGVLLRSGGPRLATLITSAFFAIIHFLKPPDGTTSVITWTSGFASIANAFVQFTEPLLVLAGFTTLFLLAWILADARIRTQSLWLPIGLHAGWIFAAATFSKLARRQILALPWLGNNLLIGIAPLCVGLLSWALLRLWLQHVNRRR
jgi:membrane protease YdiL (CAAX protease family)